MTSFPARLHVLLAPRALRGVVIRRGPSNMVCTIGWDLKTDAFKTGQWLKARLYERRSDLSPDGRHLIYFAMDCRWDSETKGSWTAVSRAPYVKALSLWPKGDAWQGGGLFTSLTSVWLNQSDKAPLRVSPEISLDRDARFKPYNRECLGVYYNRLQRDGWTLIERVKDEDAGRALFEKKIDERWTLRKIAHETTDHPEGKGCYYDEHELVDGKTAAAKSLRDWEWVELDRNRVIWAEKGKIYSAPKDPARGIGEPRELADFNAMTFEPLEAPY